MIHGGSKWPIPSIISRCWGAVTGAAIVSTTDVADILIVIVAVATATDNVIVVHPNILAPGRGTTFCGSLMAGATLPGSRNVSANLVMAVLTNAQHLRMIHQGHRAPERSGVVTLTT